MDRGAWLSYGPQGHKESDMTDLLSMHIPSIVLLLGRRKAVRDRLALQGGTGDFPGGPVARTLCSQCRGPGFDPWSRNYEET